MGCFHPLKGYRSSHVNPSGKRSLMVVGRGAVDVHKKALTVSQAPAFLPCGRCIGCRRDRAMSWAVRCVHESQMHPCSSFVTLTYSDKFLPKDGSLVYRDFQLFMKRLRIAITRKAFKKRFRKLFSCDSKALKFYMCGEYGKNYNRPHYHACLFGVDFPDKVLLKERDGVRLYTSLFLEKVWKKGFVTIGEVTFASALYLAKYVMKQFDGDLGGAVYQGRKPEFGRMSRGGRTGKGLGYTWFEKYQEDVFPKDFIIIRGKHYRVPKYYMRKYMLTNRSGFDSVREDRYDKESQDMMKRSLKEIYRQMDACEVVHKQFHSMSTRSLDN